MRGALGLCVLSGLSALMLGACVGAPESGDVGEAVQGVVNRDGSISPSGKGTGVLASDSIVNGGADQGSDAVAQPQSAVAKITNHGGPVMNAGTIHTYIIWYGNWAGNTGTTIIPSFLGSIGGSPYFNINSTYGVPNSVTLAGQTTVAYPYGTSLSDATIQTIVSNAITGGALPSDTSGVYFVLTSADVNESSGFCTQYCGWHTHGTIGGKDIKYSVVGNADRCITSCADQSTGPNNNAGVDGMVSVIAHELEEAATDPDLNAWYDSSGAENGDKCAWTFGTTHTAANGSLYNVTLGGKQYLIQQNWLASTPQGCAMSH